MSWYRWKMLAGILSASLGGLATVGGQCPKPEVNKNKATGQEVMISADPPAIPQAPPAPVARAAVMPPAPMLPVNPPAPEVLMPGIPSAPMLVPPVPSQSVPPAPVLLPPVAQNKLPSTVDMPVLPAGGLTPQAPAPDVVLPASPPSVPTSPSVPRSGGPAADGVPQVSTPELPPKIAAEVPAKPAPTPAEPARSPVLPMTQLDPLIANPVVATTPPVAAPKSAPAIVPASSVTTESSRLRIVLRVGEGEPNFEVRNGDDLLLKVKSEKIDVKSPEKGSGLSAVKASGKVHFVGFGAEGTCEDLSFLAGTGEVTLTGAVKIQVKDKLGRVESELTTESVKYKIDASTLGGSLKP